MLLGNLITSRRANNLKAAKELNPSGVIYVVSQRKKEFWKSSSIWWSYDKNLVDWFLPARRYARAGLCYSDVSLRPSVRHTPVLCLAERKQDREKYTIW